MKSLQKMQVFRCRQEIFHAESLTWRCSECGFEKLGTNDVHISMDDIDKPEPVEEKEPERPKKPDKYIKKGDSRKMNIEWVEYMFREHPAFKYIYKSVVPYDVRQKYELNNVRPHHRVIMNDILYDTDRSEMFYTRDYTQNDGTIIRTYYYKNNDGSFYHIMMSVDGIEDFSTDEPKDIKKLLANDPETYMAIISDKILNMEEPEPEDVPPGMEEEINNVVQGTAGEDNPAVPKNRTSIK